MTAPANAIGGLIACAIDTLRSSSDSPRLDAEVLLAYCLDRPRSFLIAHEDETAGPDAARRFGELIAARAAGMPVAYLTGVREFWSLRLAVSSDTLIPRPETERLVELALDRIAVGQKCRVADLGTGSGAIALAIASERPLAAIVATDISEGALAIARENAIRLGFENIEFLHGDWFTPLAGQRFDLIVANPPYVADDDAHLHEGDVAREPRVALEAGANGLDAIRRIAAEAFRFLQPGGAVLVEHGSGQGHSVRQIFCQHGLKAVATFNDLAGHERVTLGKAQ